MAISLVAVQAIGETCKIVQVTLHHERYQHHRELLNAH